MRAHRVIRQKAHSAARLLNTVRRSLETEGVGPATALLSDTLRSLARRSKPKPPSEFDLTHGVDTGGIVRISSMEIDSPNYVYAVYYKASRPEEVRKVLSALPVRHEDFTFVDFGSGKGLALMVASMYPFKRIIGVEFAADLHRIAESNLSKFHPEDRRCFDVQSVHADAAAWPVPAEPLVCYFYEPFEAPVLEKTLVNLEEATKRSSQPMLLLYHHAPADSVLHDNSIRNEALIVSRGFRRVEDWAHEPYALFATETAIAREAAARC